jgi:hypothetical protein
MQMNKGEKTMGAVTAPESDRLSIRRLIYLRAYFTRSLARTVGIAGWATLVLACAMVCPASARGGGGGGGHGGSMMGGSGHGASMMGVSGFAGPTSMMNSNNVGCINNKYSSRCAGNEGNNAK